MKSRRRLVLAPLAATTVVLAFASVAYACTTIVGTIETKDANGNVCPNRASQGTLCQVSTGTMITSTGNYLDKRTDANNPDPNNPVSNDPGSPATTQWGLYFLRYQSNQDDMDSCMGDLLAGEQKVGTKSEVQGSDNSVTISGEIPGPRPLEPSGTGSAHVCFISESTLTGAPNYRWGTPSTELALL